MIHDLLPTKYAVRPNIKESTARSKIMWKDTRKGREEGGGGKADYYK